MITNISAKVAPILADKNEDFQTHRHRCWLPRETPTGV